MTNRYVTEKEKEGTKRRMEEYRQRLAAAGIKTRAYQLSEAEHEAVKRIIERWRLQEGCDRMNPMELINLVNKI